jgi:hypothetical protein
MGRFRAPGLYPYDYPLFLLCIAVGPVDGKRRSTNSDILRTLRFGGTISNPFTPVGNHRLTSQNVEDATPVFKPENALQNHCIFLEIGCLPGFDPTSGTTHVSDAKSFYVRVYTADVLVD